MKQEVVWLGDSRKVARSFPKTVRKALGADLMAVQLGQSPADWRPMKTIGPGVREIRITHRGEYRALYITHIGDRVHVLHAFRKKTRRTAKADQVKARDRLRELQKERRSG